jgi:protein ImuB
MFAVIFISNFSLQAVLRHEPDLRPLPIALVDPQATKSIITQSTSAAQACGVCEGLTASQAMARCAELIIKPRSPAQEESATEVLLQTAYAFSPNIESTAPGVCTIELKGVALGSLGSMEQWAQKIIEVLAQFNIATKIGLAATPELALLAARAAAPILSLSQKHPTSNIQHRTTNDAQSGNLLDVGCSMLDVRCSQERNLELFPISSLEPSPEILAILQRWGIQTVGALLALGKDSVTERLGQEAVELFNRVSPDSPRPLKLVVPNEEFSEQLEFENEIETVEPLLFVLRRFVEQLSRRLELIYLVIAEFHLQLGLSSGAKHERVFKIPAPTGNIDVLFRMLQTHLETVRTDASITSLRLTAKPTPPESRQFGLFESTLRDPNQFAETAARLTALVGSEKVGRPELIATHKPDSFRMAAPVFNDGQENRTREAFDFQKGNPLDVQGSMFDVRCSQTQGQENKIGLSLRRFRPPRPSHVEFRDSKPALLRSEVFIGAIVETRGPFFSSGNWWDNGQWAREEWDVETSDGSLFRIFRSSEGCFVDGIYD